MFHVDGETYKAVLKQHSIYTETRAKFDEHRGIFTPIYAYALDLGTINGPNLVKHLSWLLATIMTDESTPTDAWEYLYSKKTPIGYMAACVSENKDIGTGFSLAAPMDLEFFNSEYGKYLAMSRALDNLVSPTDPTTGIYAPVIHDNRKVYKCYPDYDIVLLYERSIGLQADDFEIRFKTYFADAKVNI